MTSTVTFSSETGDVGESVACKDGDLLLSGGCSSYGIQGMYGILTTNAPVADNGWSCHVQKGGVGQLTLTAHAICLAKD